MTAAASGIEVVVDERVDATGDVAVLTLVRIDGRPFPLWEPGDHVDLLLPGADGQPLARQYSLCGERADRRRWRVAVLREPYGRGGSEHIWTHIGPGTTLRVRGPRNHFRFIPAERCRFVAGGIGITALLAMLDAAEARGIDWRLDYAGRSRAAMAFLDELEGRFGDRVHAYAADAGQRLDLDALLASPDPGLLVYACGPRRMLDAVEAAADSWPDGALRWERFVAKEFDEPVSQEAFEVELTLSGLTLTVSPDRTVLQTVEAAGVLVPSSCQEGTCGTCETIVTDGVVEHRDSVLTPGEQKSHQMMMICCSRARSDRLVLDL